MPYRLDKPGRRPRRGKCTTEKGKQRVWWTRTEGSAESVQRHEAATGAVVKGRIEVPQERREVSGELREDGPRRIEMRAGLCSAEGKKLRTCGDADSKGKKDKRTEQLSCLDSTMLTSVPTV